MIERKNGEKLWWQGIGANLLRPIPPWLGSMMWL